MSRRRQGAADDLEIEFEGFARVTDAEAADVSFGHAPFGHGSSRGGGRRWPFVLAVTGAVALMGWFLATRSDGGSPDTAGKGATETTRGGSSDRAAGSTTTPRSTTAGSSKTTTAAQRSPTVVTLDVGGAPLMGAPTGRTLHFTDQGASVTFALDVDSGQLRQVPVKAGVSHAVVTPGRLVGLTFDGRLAIVGNDGGIEVSSPAAGVVAVGDGSVWVAVPDNGRLRLNRLIPASDLVTESRMSPGPTQALVGSDANGNAVVLAADGHLYAITADGTAVQVSLGTMVAHAVGGGNRVVAGAYGETTCSASMNCVDVLHSADGGVVELMANDASARSYAFSPNGDRVAVVDAGVHSIDVYDFSGRPPFVVDVGNAGTAQVPTWSPDGRFFFTYVNRQVHWGDISNGRTGSFQLTRPGVALVLVGAE